MPMSPRPDDGFARRHIGPSPADVAAMLEVLGVGSLDELVEQTLPATIREHERSRLPAARTEPEVLARLRELAAQNRPRTSLIGMGYSPAHTPRVIRRNVLENPAWYTAYTPYQPEISQGR
ncbi:MAG: glycine dehydrogenase (aminomethyl-transferring), partial [Acidimicrobiales bacterium]